MISFISKLIFNQKILSNKKELLFFCREYFPQIRPYFKNRSIVIQLIEHLWSNMIESSKVAFLEKILKEQDIHNRSPNHSNDTDTFSNDGMI
jgi:hypothetical protein